MMDISATFPTPVPHTASKGVAVRSTGGIRTQELAGPSSSRRPSPGSKGR
jgi:hypothetical protein